MSDQEQKSEQDVEIPVLRAQAVGSADGVAQKPFEPAEPVAAQPAAPVDPAAAGAAAKQESDLTNLLVAVLDAADVANRSAATATELSTKMVHTTRTADATLAKARKLGTVLIASFSGVILFCIVALVVVSFQLGSRTGQLDALLLSTSKRVVELNAGMVQLAEARQSIENFGAQQQSIVDAQASLLKTIEEQKAVSLAAAEAANAAVGEVKATLQAQAQAQSQAQAQAQQPQKPAPPPPQLVQLTQAAQQLQQSQQSAVAQLKALDAAMRNQARSLSVLESKVATVDATAQQVQVLRRELQAVLEFERRQRVELEAVPAAQRERVLKELEKQRFVQYPQRPGGPAPANTEGGPRAN